MSPIPVQLLQIYILAGLLCGAPVLSWLARVPLAQAGWRWTGWRAVLPGVGWGLLLATAGVYWLRVLLQTGNYLPIPSVPTPVDWLVLVLLAPVAEELFFRGVIFGALQRSWRLGWAVFLSAIVYTAAHPGEPWLAFLFLAGIGYALAFRAAGSVLAPMLAHAMVAAVLLLARVHPGHLPTLPVTAFLWAGGGAVACILVGSVFPHPER